MIEHRIDPAREGFSWAELNLDDLARAYELPTRYTSSYSTLDNYWESSAYSKGKDPWLGAHSKKECSEVLTDGWKAGADKLKETASIVTGMPACKARKRVRKVTDQGEELRIEKALSGDWDQAWETRRREITFGSQIVELFCVIDGNCERTQEELFWCGAASLIVIDQLEQAGYSVQVTGIHVTSFTHQAISANNLARLDIIIKQASEPVRLDALAACLCSTAVYRGLLLRALEMFPQCRAGHGYENKDYEGCILVLKDLNAAVPDEAIIMGAQCFSKKLAIREVNRVLSLVQGA